jgi:Asp-tRNA(Asn)/Glu-tRNA(Gln) amidotransferase A subunit family amidase
MATEPCDLTVAEAASEIAAGELTAAILVRSCLRRIDALENEIQAWALVDKKGALEAAERLDLELQAGYSRGPLHGIPVGIKDIFHVAGLPTRAGSKFWTDCVPSYDATSVALLKEAGAIILGKTHTTEFAYFHPAPTRNPWNVRHTPGGSSSGSAAAVAAGMCLAALGSQTLGSVLRPAAFNGVAGFKPTYGRVSTYGVVPLAWTFDHVGILARSVKDATTVFQVLAGYDPKDYLSLNAAVPDCTSDLESSRRPVLGLLKEYFFDNADEEMRRHMEPVLESLRQAGAEIKEIGLPPGFRDVMADGAVIMAVEAAAYHQEMFVTHKNEYGAETIALIERGLNTSATEYARKLQSRLRQIKDATSLFQEADVLLTPGATGAAPYGLASTGNPVMQGPWTILGVPTISLPTGLNGNGLPLAIQLVGPPLAEGRLLAAARWCERALDTNLRPPCYS